MYREKDQANLPTGFPRESCNTHAVLSSPRTRMACTRRTCEFVAGSIATCELDGQTFPVEIRAVFAQVLLLSSIDGSFENLRMAAQWISGVS
jgi:hypothetical protein